MDTPSNASDEPVPPSPSPSSPSPSSSSSSSSSSYREMMASIRGKHSMANTIRFFKLPLILTDQRLYAGAITQFMWVTKALETRLREHGGDGDGDGDGGGGGGGDKGTALVAVLT